MNCFRPDPYDYSLKAVPKTFETAKALVIRLEEGKIELCSHKGTLLESVSLTDVQWSPCSLPAGGDHCLSLQFKQPQPREILLSAKSRAAVHHLIRALDRAASKHKGGKISETPVKEETKSSSTSQQRPVTRDAGTLAGIESHDVNKANEFQRILEEQENHWVRQIQSLEKDLQLKISDMKREVEAARAKAKSMETKNVDLEVKLKDSVASITSEKAKVGEMSLERERLKTSFLQVQEEKEVGARTCC